MPAETFSKPLESMLRGKCDYEYYNYNSDAFSSTSKTRICHVKLNAQDYYNKNVVLMVFTIRNQSGKWKIHSEGPLRTDPGATVPLKNAAVKLAERKGWKYLSVAIAGDGTPNTETVAQYVVSMESYTYGNETVYDLTEELKELENRGKPDFYRCQVEVNDKEYAFSFIKRDRFVEYLTMVDNRSYTDTINETNQNNISDVTIYNAEEYGHLTLQDLGKILRNMYDNADGGSKVSSIHVFGIKYGKVIRDKGYKATEIIRASGINESYATELHKGLGSYDCIKANKYGISFNAQEIVAVQEAEEKEPIPYAWYVGATGHDENGNWTDFSDLYIAEGRWENGWDDKFVEDVKSMQVGDRIAIKAAYTKKNGLPFKNNGKVVGVMGIKAIGIITENSQDGKHIKVDWTRIAPAKEWYGAGVLRQTVHYVSSDESYTRKALLDFTFNDVAQDYTVCEEQYADECEASASDMAQAIVRTPRINKMHPLNCILFGAPGTGKTYATAEYALAFIENREVDLRKKSIEERKVVMDSYNDYLTKEQIVFTTFHQSYGYEDFIQGLRPEAGADNLSFTYVDGVFKRIADVAKNDLENNYVIIIDEINRANISKVFGELITLIEEDKRDGEVNAVRVVLPSGSSFTVPNNLYIIGTMNSADKSISLIDTALRRRFDFIEVIPRAEFIENEILRGIMKKLNESLVNELDSTDLLIGHSYFMGKTEADICNIMNRNIIPLLYEYFYDNSKKVKALVESVIAGYGLAIKKESMGRIRLEKQD